MMLSRVAENLYWMARYLERAENTARIINVNSHLLLDLPKRVRIGWKPIIEILGLEESFYSVHETADEKKVIQFIIGGSANPSSMMSSLLMARENARTVRDILPREAWEQINNLFLEARGDFQSGAWRKHRYDYLRRIIVGDQAVTGILSGAMTHHEGYEFMKMGRSLERADMTSRVIDVQSASLLPEVSDALKPFESIQWMSVLKSLTAYQMYRHTIHPRVRRPDVLDFLFLDRRFPRSFYFSILEVETCLMHVPRDKGPLRALVRVKKQLKAVDPSALAQDELHLFIDELQIGLAKLHEAIAAAYFGHFQEIPKKVKAVNQ